MMRKRIIWITVCMVCILFGAYQYTHLSDSTAAFSGAQLQSGSRGQDVTELQGRLAFLGYYYGKVDGVFGSKTQGSVKWFQSQFGLKVDGIVGSKTRAKLVKATKNWSPSSNTAKPPQSSTGKPKSKPSGSNNLGLTENDLKLMANAVYGEARGEPYEGQVAVAAVIINRIKSPSFPNTASGVIFQPRAFTAVADGQIYLTPNEKARQAVQDAVDGWDPSGGCLYYFNPVTATSKWIWTRPQVKTIGKHIFCM